MSEPEEDWKKLLNASKPALKDPGTKMSDAPPPRIGTLRETVRSLLLALTWRRWSLLAALLAMILLITLFLLRERPQDPTLIEPEPMTSPFEP